VFIPKPFKINDMAEIHKFIEEFGFGILVSDSLTGTHIPFVLKANEGEHGTLYAHCAKANPHWKELQNNKVLVIFTGPHSYISPNWYAKGPAVPTWNYTAVHAYGTATLLNDNDALNAINDVVQQYEPTLLQSSTVLTNEYKHKLLSGIVAFKIELTALEGQLKLGQQKSQSDQLGVYNALKDSNRLDDQALAQYMEKVNIGTGS